VFQTFRVGDLDLKVFSDIALKVMKTARNNVGFNKDRELKEHRHKDRVEFLLLYNKVFTMKGMLLYVVNLETSLTSMSRHQPGLSLAFHQTLGPWWLCNHYWTLHLLALQ
jgi:hypothetical protein